MPAPTAATSVPAEHLQKTAMNVPGWVPVSGSPRIPRSSHTVSHTHRRGQLTAIRWRRMSTACRAAGTGSNGFPNVSPSIERSDDRAEVTRSERPQVDGCRGLVIEFLRSRIRRARLVQHCGIRWAGRSPKVIVIARLEKGMDSWARSAMGTGRAKRQRGRRCKFGRVLLGSTLRRNPR